MRIAVLTSSYPRFDGDGSGTFVRSLCTEYVREGHSVEVIAPDDARVSTQDATVPVYWFRYAPAAWSIMGHGRALYADIALKRATILLSPLYALAALRTLRTRQSRGTFDWLHAHWLIPSGVLASGFKRSGGSEFIVTLHGSDVYLAEKTRLLRSMIKHALAQAEAVCGVSRDLSQRGQAIGATRRPILTIPNGVDTDVFHPHPVEACRLRLRLGIAHDQPVILAVGRLVRKKGFDILLESLASVQTQIPNVLLLICGEGDLFSELRSLATALGIANAVRWLGHVAWRDLPDYYSAANVCAWPSVRDAMGNVDGLPVALLEGMACARPVVATRVAGIPEVVQHGQNGLLVEPRDPTTLAEAVVSLLLDRQRATCLGMRARETVVASFTWSHVARQYLSLAAGLS